MNMTDDNLTELLSYRRRVDITSARGCLQLCEELLEDSEGMDPETIEFIKCRIKNLKEAIDIREKYSRGEIDADECRWRAEKIMYG